MMQNLKEERNFFNRYAHDIGYDAFDDAGHKRLVGEFLKYFTPTRGLKALDVGCGTGAFTESILGSNMELYGIDVADACVSYAKKKYKDVIFTIGNVEELPYLSDYFDVVFASGLLHHFPDFFYMLKECWRVLKKGGILFSYDPNRRNPFMYLFRCKESPLYSPKGVTVNEQPITREEVIGALKATDFAEYEVYAVSGITFNRKSGKAHPLCIWLYNFAARMFSFSCFYRLNRRFGFFLITYAKK